MYFHSLHNLCFVKWYFAKMIHLKSGEEEKIKQYRFEHRTISAYFESEIFEQMNMAFQFIISLLFMVFS